MQFSVNVDRGELSHGYQEKESELSSNGHRPRDDSRAIIANVGPGLRPGQGRVKTHLAATEVANERPKSLPGGVALLRSKEASDKTLDDWLYLVAVKTETTEGTRGGCTLMGAPKHAIAYACA